MLRTVFLKRLLPSIYFYSSKLLLIRESGKATDVNRCEKSSYSKNDVHKIILQPFNYIEQSSDRHFEIRIIKAFNNWLNIPLDKCKEIGEIIEMLQNATLLIDDIEDNSSLRRGVPAAHIIFGIGFTISSGNYAYCLVMERILQLGHTDAIAVFLQQLFELHLGQGIDIYWRDNFICPTEHEYKEMVKSKTGGLLGLGVRLMQLFSTNKSDFTSIIALIGYYTQILNDYKSLQSKEFFDNKSFCEDFTEGKFSFPIIHSIRSNPGDIRIMNILRLRTTDVEIKKYAMKLLENTGSFEYSRNVLKELEDQIRMEINRLGGNQCLTAILDEIKLQ